MGACLNSSQTIQLPPQKADTGLASLGGSRILVAFASLSIDDFQIERVIGKGGYGKVYLVNKEDTQMSYAMKSFSVEQDLDEVALELEIMTSEINECPYIVPVRYVIIANDKLYMLTDYSSPGTLLSFVRDKGNLSQDALKVYLAELVIALEFLHCRGYVYHDLNPDNLLLGPDGHLLLSSFGVGKKDFIFSKTCPELERTGYEVQSSLRGKPSGDFWSLVKASQGAVMFELLTGESPFGKDLDVRRELEDRLLPDVAKRSSKGICTAASNLVFLPDAIDLIQMLVSISSDSSQESVKSIVIGDVINSNYFRGTDWSQVRHKQHNPPIKLACSKRLLTNGRIPKTKLKMSRNSSIDWKEM